MPRFFTSLINLVTYKEPSDVEGFELLESENEKVGKGKSDNKTYQDKKAEKNKAKTAKKSTTPEDKVDPVLQVNLERIKNEFNAPANADIITREFKIARRIRAFIVYIDGMVDRQTINNSILRRLMQADNHEEYFKEIEDSIIVDYMLDNVLSLHETARIKDYKEIIFQVLYGDTALFIDGCREAVLFETNGYEKRQVGKPNTESVVRGSMEGFTESLRTNITLVRKQIKYKDLITEMIPVGRISNIYCAVLYIKGLTNPELVKEVKRRITAVDVDFVSGDGMMAQIIQDNELMVFPQVLSTERPDRSASFLLEGQVVVLTEGTPFSNVVPVTFYNFIHTSEDSFVSWQFATFLRVIRVIGLLTALLLPGLYVALIGYHQEMIPTALLGSIAKTRENVPFPTVVEVLFMELSFELIREAGIRVPGVIGQTLGIVGAVILGQAAVAADIVSSILIIIVAITGLGSFAIPNYSFSFAVRITRFVFILFGSITGFFGISAALFILGCLACSMKSFGVPYFSPVAPKTKTNRDLILKKPISGRRQRPDYMNVLNRNRSKGSPRKWKDNK